MVDKSSNDKEKKKLHSPNDWYWIMEINITYKVIQHKLYNAFYIIPRLY